MTAPAGPRSAAAAPGDVLAGDAAPADDSGTEIAVVGLSGRFPGARGVDELWRVLAEGRETIRRFSDDELAEAGVPEAIRRAPGFVPARGVIDGAEELDVAFFGFTPREAEATDPQHRVFLECCWEALETAGCDPARYPGLVGVYAGVDASPYAMTHLMTAEDRLQGLIGNDKDYLATRVCFKLDLRGPGLTVQTACSTSLVAVQVACQGLLGYQCDLALAGGVGIGFPRRAGYLYQEGGILSPDGRCRAFDAAARGTVPSDGAGVVALKRLADALADGDPIRAVIRGAAINNDGGAKIGFTAPGIEGQAAAIALALAGAGIDPATIGYLEAHGTATELGDPAEIAALTDVFRAATDRRGFCAIGSLKSNLGHMNSAAGIGGLIKTVLLLERKKLVPSLHFERPNPRIDFAASPFYVNTELREWPDPGHPRRAGVSSFGVGGTNAHVVIEEAPPPAAPGPARPHQALVVSARTPAALARASAELAGWLRAHPETPLADVAYTLQVGRARHGLARVVAAADAGEAARALERDGAVIAAPEAPPQVAFLFPGQGAQHAGMAAGVYGSEPLFRERFDRCAEHVAPLLGADLREVLFGAGDPEAAADRLADTAIAQPALLAVEICLAELWRAWGIEPAALLGHSLGEYAAACVAGVMSIEDALSLVAARARLIAELPPGEMVSVAVAEADLPPLGQVEVAAVNGPESVVLSGPPEAIAAAVAELERRGAGVTRLYSGHAFHSAMLDPVLERFRDEVRKVKLASPRVPLLSSLTGTWLRPEQATDPGYWVEQLRRPVRFSAGLAELTADPGRLLLEVGPGRSLATLVRRHRETLGERTAASLPHPRDPEPDTRSLAAAAGWLHAHRVPLDWTEYHRGGRRRRVPLPTYPFERRRYFRRPPAIGALFGAAEAAAPATAELRYPSWRRLPPERLELDGRAEQWLVGGERTPFAEALAGELRRALDDVETAWPEDETGWRAALERLAAEGRPPARIVLAAGLGAAPDSEPLGRLMALQRALAKAAPGLAAEVTVVTVGTADVSGEDGIRPWNLALLGPCRVVPQERPRVSLRLLDLAAADLVRDPAGTAAAAAVEVRAAGWPDRHLARRGTARWAPAFDPAPAAPGRERSSVHDGGVYLITGGLGELGLRVAGHLARAARVRLALTGREGLPARETWDRLAAELAAGHPLAGRIRVVRALEATGAEVEVLAADAADRAAMERALAAVEARFGRLDGVVHAAGVSGAAAFRAAADTAPDDCERIVAAKARGAELLAELLPGEIGFCVLFSSISTVLGGRGLAAYAAANHVLDGIAQRERRRGRRWCSVAWDAWRTGGGLEALGLAAGGLAPEAGLAALDRVLAGDAERWVVSASDLEARRRREAESAAADTGGAAGAFGTAGERHERPADLDVEYVAPRDELERELAAIWEELFGIEPVGVEDNFFRLGGDSLVAIQLAGRLRSALGVELGVNDLFDVPTVAGLARRVAEAQAGGTNGTPAGDTPAGATAADGVESTLALVESLSDEEVRRMLAEMEGR